VNEPMFVIHTAAMVAKVKRISLEEVDHATTQNAEHFFGWDQRE
jgi:Tat protein secretion system quality control protein TatD with DNase activity